EPEAQPAPSLDLPAASVSNQLSPRNLSPSSRLSPPFDPVSARGVAMPATVPQVAPDIGPILALVRRTRWLLRSSWGAVGVGLTLGLAFACLVAAAAADMLVPLVGPWLRLAGLLAFAGPTLVVFAWKGLLPLGRRLRNVEVARRIEGRIPGMHSRLVSCMDLAGREGQVSPAFHRKLVSESLDRIGTYRAGAVIDWRGAPQAAPVFGGGRGRLR